MKKLHIISLGLTIISVLFFINCSEAGAFTFTKDKFQYETNDDGTVTVTKYFGNEEEVVIPNSIFYNKQNWVVKEIGYRCFSDSKNMKSLFIPRNVTTIIENLASVYSSNFKEIKVDERNPYFESLDGVLYSRGLECLLRCPSGMDGKLVISSKTQSLSEYAFYRCGNLLAIEIPESVTEIGEGSFQSCKSIQNLIIPQSVINFNTTAVNDCKSLKYIILPERVADDKISGFKGCESLKQFEVPASVKTIDDGAFTNCASLTKITIPASTTFIDPYSFCGCCSVESIIIDDNNPVYSSQGCMILNKEGGILHKYLAGKGHIELPEGIVEINDGAFYCTTDLTSIVLPSSLKKLTEFSFCEDFRLETIVCFAEEPPALTGAFMNTAVGDHNPIDIYVPGKSLELYKVARGWRYYVRTLYTIPGTEESGVELVSTSDTESFEVYNLNGVMVLKTGNKDDLQTLPKGIYIINGQKVVR